MVARPTVVYLFEQRLDVEFEDRPASRLTSKGNDLAGHYDSGKATLHVDGLMALDAQKETVLHEVAHAILALTGQTEGERKDERMAQAMGMGMLALLRANPELVAWLVER